MNSFVSAETTKCDTIKIKGKLLEAKFGGPESCNVIAYNLKDIYSIVKKNGSYYVVMNNNAVLSAMAKGDLIREWNCSLVKK